MQLNKIIKKIRVNSLIAFLIPLITINICWISYNFLNEVKLYPNFNWNNKNLTVEKFNNSLNKASNFTDCPKYDYKILMINKDGEIINEENFTKDIYVNNEDGQETIDTLKKELISFDVSSFQIRYEERIPAYKKSINTYCIKNKPLINNIFTNFSFIENFFILAKKNNFTGFSNVKNPYVYGEVSISRTARYFPINLIFKPFIIISAFFLFMYWKNNLKIFNTIGKIKQNQNFSKVFYYFGILSCVFLMLHAIFLGVDLNSKIFTRIRKLILILFIIFEVVAQISLTINLYKFKNQLKNLISFQILDIKIFYVICVTIITLFLFTLLATVDIKTSYKHILEWNYFSVLLFYYFLSRILWRLE